MAMGFNLRLSPRWLWALLLGLTVVKLVVAARVELLPEEAYYWTYWQHPSLSYFDHPPLVAWTIGLGTAIWGDTEFGVRFGFIVLSLGSVWLMYRLALAWFDARTAAMSAGIFAVIPLYAGIGLLAFPDGPLIFFWLLTLLAVTHAVRTGRTWWWLLAGFAFGGALLSKYYAVLLAPSLALFLLVIPRHRHWLWRWSPWTALVVAVAMFSPVVVWNYRHDWASFLFQATRTAGEYTLASRTVPEFWLVQLAVLSPLVALAIGWSAYKAVRRRTEADRFALAFGVPLFAIFAWASFKTEVHINWTAPAFLSLLPATVANSLAGCASGSRGWRWVPSAIWATCILMIIGGIAYLYRNSGWRDLAQFVETAEHELEAATGLRAFIVGADKYNLAAELSFYTREPEEQVNVFAFGKKGLGFRYWVNLEEWRGHPAIAVLTGTNHATMAELREHFRRHDPPRRLDAPMPGRKKRAVYLVNCYDYQP